VKTYVLITCLLIAPFFLAAQNVTGFWKGKLDMPSSCFPVNNIELQLKGTAEDLTGSSYHYLDVNYYVKKNARGQFNESTQKLTISEGMVTTFKIPPNCSVCIKNFQLTYSRKGNQEFLTGTWNGKIEGTGVDCATGPIVLTRIKESAFKEVPEIIVDTGTIRLDFYDNGTVDGDSITVLVNKRVVLSHQILSTRPKTAFIVIDLNNKFHEVEMVAENLGTIPPNTSLLIITAGEKKYQLVLSSSRTKSAMVRFIYEKPVDKKKT
jgi:hypothetical protein